MSWQVSTVFSAMLLLQMPAHATGTPQDSDGDGIRDNHEKILGTDPDIADVPQPVIRDGVESEAARERSSYDATKDIVDIAMCHVGEDRYLWRATLDEVPRMDDTVFHLYIDADANEETGRKGAAGSASTGTDYMLSIVRGGGGAATGLAGGPTGAADPR